MQTHMTQRILMEIVFASVTKCEGDWCFTGTSWGTLRGFSKQSAFAAMQTAVLFVVQDGASDGKSITDTLEQLGNAVVFMWPDEICVRWRRLSTEESKDVEDK